MESAAAAAYMVSRGTAPALRCAIRFTAHSPTDIWLSTKQDYQLTLDPHERKQALQIEKKAESGGKSHSGDIRTQFGGLLCTLLCQFHAEYV